MGGMRTFIRVACGVLRKYTTNEILLPIFLPLIACQFVKFEGVSYIAQRRDDRPLRTGRRDLLVSMLPDLQTTTVGLFSRAGVPDLDPFGSGRSRTTDLGHEHDRGGLSPALRLSRPSPVHCRAWALACRTRMRAGSPRQASRLEQN